MNDLIRLIEAHSPDRPIADPRSPEQRRIRFLRARQERFARMGLHLGKAA